MNMVTEDTTLHGMRRYDKTKTLCGLDTRHVDYAARGIPAARMRSQAWICFNVGAHRELPPICDTCRQIAERP